jgi:hypothetical protein
MTALVHCDGANRAVMRGFLFFRGLFLFGRLLFLCGLLHDLPFAILSYAKAGRPPYFTITAFLTLNGLLVVLSEKAGFRLTDMAAGTRWLTHVAILVGCYLAALHLTTWIAVG